MSRDSEDPHGLAYAQIYARVFNHFARSSGLPAKAIARAAACSEPYISMISRAGRLPSLDKTQDLDRAIGADGTLYDVRRLLERLRGHPAGQAASVGIERPSFEEEDPVRRRELLQDTAALAAAASVAPILAALTQAWQDSESKIAGASVSQGMIDDWESAASMHAKRARTDTPDVVLAALAVEFTDMAPHLRMPQPAKVRHDLAHAAARHAALIAGKWHDLGNRREAHRWWVKTRGLSDEAGDRLLSSWLRGRETLHRRGDPLEDPAHVLLIAKEARTLAGPKPSAPLVRALTEEAKTLAIMGRVEEASAALREAEDVFGRLPGPTGVYRSMSEHDLWFDRSLVFTLAGDVERAIEAQDKAEALYPTADQAAPRIRLHRAALQAPSNPEEAVHTAALTIDALPMERMITRYASDTQLVLKALPEQARALPAARELRALASGVAPADTAGTATPISQR